MKTSALSEALFSTANKTVVRSSGVYFTLEKQVYLSN